jgi:hypothetical protein
MATIAVDESAAVVAVHDSLRFFSSLTDSAATSALLESI